MGQTLNRIAPTYAYDASTSASSIVDVPDQWQGFAEFSNSQPSTTTTIGFFTRDPIGYEGSDWNLYEYCGTMPLHMNDPSGNIYGNWCGALRSGPGAPIDDIDRACMNHDICLATWVEFVTPCRRRICDRILCWAVLTPPYSCIGSPNYLNCVTAASALQALFCYGFGTAPLPYP